MGAHDGVVPTAELERERSARLQAEERLRLLRDLGEEFAAVTTDDRRLLEVVARRMGELVGESCAIRLLAEDGVWLETDGAVYHPDPRLVAVVRELMLAQPVRVGEGLSGRVIATGEPVFLPQIDPEQLAPFVEPKLRPLLAQFAVRSLLAIPLRAQGRTIGVAFMARRDPARPFTEQDRHLLEDVAGQAALAIANASLFAKQQRELAERKKAEEALLRTEEQFRQAQKMEAVGRLAGGVAHDFNNLLTVILSYCGLLGSTLPPNDPVRSGLSEIEKAGQRAAELTRQLLAFSRQQVQKLAVLDLNEVLGSIEKMLRRLLGEDIDVVIRRDPIPAKVKADAGQMQQVVMNLVLNASDAMPEGGTLTIETGHVVLDEAYAADHLGVTPGPHVLLAVSDTGIGMDELTRRRIFEPFFTTKEQGKGTGLGLSTVFGIVQQSGGSIWVYSEPGRGSTFKVYLPSSTEPVTPTRPPVQVAPLTGSETILLAEDDEQLRTVTARILERAGYRVLAARTGSEALLACHAHEGPIHLLLTDVIMPQMNGPELARTLAPRLPGLRVIYMSGYTGEAIANHRLLNESAELLEKPITPERLLGKIREVLAALPAGD